MYMYHCLSIYLQVPNLVNFVTVTLFCILAIMATIEDHLDHEEPTSDRY